MSAKAESEKESIFGTVNARFGSLPHDVTRMNAQFVYLCSLCSLETAIKRLNVIAPAILGKILERVVPLITSLVCVRFRILGWASDTKSSTTFDTFAYDFPQEEDVAFSTDEEQSLAKRLKMAIPDFRTTTNASLFLLRKAAFACASTKVLAVSLVDCGMEKAQVSCLLAFLPSGTWIF